MPYNFFGKVIVVALLSFFTSSGNGQVGKKLFFPDKISRIPANNDYKNDESEYSFKHMVQGDNIAIFWHKEFGDDPTLNSNEKNASTPTRH